MIENTIKKKKLPYKEKDFDIFDYVVYIFIPFFTMIFTILVYYAEDFVGDILHFLLQLVATALFFFFCLWSLVLISSTKDVTYFIAKISLIFWTLFLAADVASLLLFFNHWMPSNEYYVNPLTFPVYFINEKINAYVLGYWEATAFLSILPSFLFSLLYLILLIREIVKRRAWRKANQLYYSEIAKESPDSAVIRQAADSGCADAALMIALDFAQKIQKNKFTLNESQLQSEAYTVRDYLVTAEGCNQKELYEILVIWADIYTKYAHYELSYSKLEKLHCVNERKLRACKLNDNASPTARSFAADALTSKVLKPVEDLLKDLKSAEDNKKLFSYYDTSSDDELSLSELIDLDNEITHGLWNPTAIDLDTKHNLTESQKEQLKRHNRIYGD